MGQKVVSESYGVPLDDLTFAKNREIKRENYTLSQDDKSEPIEIDMNYSLTAHLFIDKNINHIIQHNFIMDKIELKTKFAILMLKIYNEYINAILDNQHDIEDRDIVRIDDETIKAVINGGFTKFEADVSFDIKRLEDQEDGEIHTVYGRWEPLYDVRTTTYYGIEEIENVGIENYDIEIKDELIELLLSKFSDDEEYRDVLRDAISSVNKETIDCEIVGAAEIEEIILDYSGIPAEIMIEEELEDPIIF